MNESEHFQCNIKQMLNNRYKRDKTVVECVHEGDWDNFTKGKQYKIYLSTGKPRIYDDGSKQYVAHSIGYDDEDELPMFRVHAKTLMEGSYDDDPSGMKGLFDDDELEEAYKTLQKPKEATMNTRVVNRLNGISLSEENLLELRQDSGHKQSVNLDIVALLKEASVIKELKLGEEALLESLKINNDTLELRVSIGKVVREENSAVWKAIEGLVRSTKES